VSLTPKQASHFGRLPKPLQQAMHDGEYSCRVRLRDGRAFTFAKWDYASHDSPAWLTFRGAKLSRNSRHSMDITTRFRDVVAVDN
jgi:hypothetical protein